MSAKYLVVDDSRLHHQMYDLIFGRPSLAGSRVLHAYDGRDGYAQFAAHPDLAMVFLDLNMPVMTGLEFLQLRQRDARHPHIPIVLVTTESSVEDEARGMAAGAWAYLRKPFHPAQLESLITKAARASQPAEQV
jgi:two-component system chemotaxis response regulator CheY